MIEGIVSWWFSVFPGKSGFFVAGMLIGAYLLLLDKFNKKMDAYLEEESESNQPEQGGQATDD